jgi:phosphoribosylanthranilate isomerase
MREANNIAEVAALSPDYMGFIFIESSPRFIGEAFDTKDLSSIAARTKKIGVFANADVVTMTDSVKRFGLDGIQLHGEESREVVYGLRKVAPQLEILKALPIRGVSSFVRLHEYEDVVDFFLLDGQEPGSGRPFDWSILDSYVSPRDFFLAGGVSAGDVNRIRSIATRVKSLRGIDVNSRVEISPGVKSIELIREVLEGVRV